MKRDLRINKRYMWKETHFYVKRITFSDTHTCVFFKIYETYMCLLQNIWNLHAHSTRTTVHIQPIASGVSFQSQISVKNLVLYILFAVPLERDQWDRDRRLGLNDTSNAVGCIFDVLTHTHTHTCLPRSIGKKDQWDRDRRLGLNDTPNAIGCIYDALRVLSVLQCVAVCCSVLQCVAVCCSVLQCVGCIYDALRVLSSEEAACEDGAVCCSVLQCVAVCCIVLQCVAVCCSAVAYKEAHIHHSATQCNTVQHSATHCNTVQHIATGSSHPSQCIYSLLYLECYFFILISVSRI